jgi:chromate transporter
MSDLSAQNAEPMPTTGDMIGVFFRIGILSFGGPAAQISLMHRMLIDEKNWLSEARFLSALSFCMLLPGPEAMQLATYAGWRLRGFVGGLIAGLLFVVPGALVMLGLSVVYVLYGTTETLSGLFYGIKATVLVIVLEALLRVSRRALKRPDHWLLAGIAFLALFLLNIPYPLIVLLAAIYGFMTPEPRGNNDDGGGHTQVSMTRTLITVAAGLLIWLGPLVVLDFAAGGGILTELGYFFSKLAVVTFGGAYAVLAYMAQDVVQHHGWLDAAAMLDGLGLAETTPGPLILVTQFVGFLAAAGEGGIWLGMAAAGVTLWATFVPCFLWIFAGAPWIEWLSTRRRLSGALAGITAAVVGVILNLSIWFALHVLFGTVEQHDVGWLSLWIPDVETFDWPVAVLSILSGVLLLRLHFGIIPVLGISGALGWAITAVL